LSHSRSLCLCLQADASSAETTEPGERGGVSSARNRPGSQRSTNRESDEQHVKHPANERQDRDKRREETRVSSGEGDSRRTERSQRSARDHPATHRDSKDHPPAHRDTKDHPASTKEYRGGGYRSERRETHKDQRMGSRDERPGKDSRSRDQRSDTRDDEELVVRSGKKSKDHPVTKHTARSDEKKTSRGADDVPDRHEADTNTSSVDKRDKNLSSSSSKQRLRYKVSLTCLRGWSVWRVSRHLSTWMVCMAGESSLVYVDGLYGG